jgi:predicted ATP-binding protein involved in virulence
MKIEKIQIENFRGFKGQQEVVFEPDVNILVGINGAGKSSILDLIGMAFNDIIDNLIYKYPKPFTINALDINFDADKTMNFVFCHAANPFFFKEHLFQVPLIAQKKVKNGKKSLIKHETHLEHPVNIPIFRYFNTKNKVQKTNHLNDFADNATQYQVYDTVFQELTQFKKIIDWFVERENIENRTKVQLKNFDYEDALLKVVRSALDIFFKHLQYVHFEHIRVEHLPKSSNASFDLCINKNGQVHQMVQLSNGEQTMILLVVDIAYRLAVANPIAAQPLQGEGVVLIDEIDAHLHPAWQREIIACLMATFPNIQFFITTHSPQVLSNLKQENIFIIENFKFVKHSISTYGADSNRILNDVFGVTERPLYAQRDFEVLHELIDNPQKVEEAHQKLEQMRHQYGANDPDLQRAQWHFEFLTTQPESVNVR